MKMPCELVIWHILPMIRRELVLDLVKDGEMTQSAAARVLGLTPAAISQYVKGKRGAAGLEDEEIRNAIKTIAQRVAGGEDVDVSEEICSVCILMREKGLPDHLFEEGGRTKCPDECPS